MQTPDKTELVPLKEEEETTEHSLFRMRTQQES